MLPNRATSCLSDSFTGICQLKQPRLEASLLSARKRRTRCQPLRCNDRPPTALLPHTTTVHETAVGTPPSTGAHRYQGVAVVTKITWANATDGINAGSLLLLIVLAHGRGATHCCRTLSALRPKSIIAIVRCHFFAVPGRLHSSLHLSLHLPLRIIAAASSRSLAAAAAYECLRTFSYWSLVYGFVDCG